MSYHPQNPVYNRYNHRGSFAQHTEINIKRLSKWIDENSLLTKNLFQKSSAITWLKKFEEKRSSLLKYNIEETVKVEGLHYVNQWYDNTKIINKSWGLISRFLSGCFLQGNVEGILIRPLFYSKGPIRETTSVHLQIDMFTSSIVIRNTWVS